MGALGLAAAMTVLAVLPGGRATSALALPLALTAPGLALAGVLAGRLDSGVMTLGLAATVSAAFYVIIAIFLNAVGVALTRTSFLIATDGVVAASCLAAFLTREANELPPERGSRKSLRAGTVIPTLAIVASAAVVYLVANLPTAPPLPYQAMFPTGPAARGANVPVVRGHSSVGLVVLNRGAGAMSYRVTAALEDGTVWTSRTISVRRAGAWRGVIAGPVPGARCRSRLQITLRDIHLRPLTELTVWLGAAHGGPDRTGATSPGASDAGPDCA